MVAGTDLCQTGESPKRGNGGGGVDLSPYQNLLLYYERLQQSYGWTMQEVDEHDIDFLLDQLMVLSLTDGRRNQKYIDDVL